MIDTKMKVIIGLGLACLILGYFAFKNPKVITKIETKTEIKEVIKYVASNTAVTGGTIVTIKDGSTSVSGSNLTVTNTTTMTVKEKEKIIEKVASEYRIHGLALGLGTYLQIDPSISNAQEIKYCIENWSIDLSYINDRDIFSLSYNHVHTYPDYLKISYQKILFLF